MFLTHGTIAHSNTVLGSGTLESALTYTSTCICFEIGLLFIVAFGRQAEMRIELATFCLEVQPFNYCPKSLH